MAFVKGQSGNPSGRPGVPAEIREKLRAAAPQAIDLLINICTDEKKPDKVRMECAQYLLDRAYGKAPQSMSIDASVGATVMTTQMSADEMLEAIKEAAKAVSASDGDKPGDTQSG